MNFLLALIMIPSFALAEDSFLKEARELAEKLRTSIMKEVQAKIAKDGLVAAVPYCHGNVKSIAGTAAGEATKKYSFGRTSHLVRNQKNKPEDWMKPYLARFKDVKKGDPKVRPVVHKFEDGKRAYLEPLFVAPLCLNCHGDKVSAEVKARIKELYPEDRAMNFKTGDFRGFIWVKEK